MPVSVQNYPLSHHNRYRQQTHQPRHDRQLGAPGLGQPHHTQPPQLSSLPEVSPPGDSNFESRTRFGNDGTHPSDVNDQDDHQSSDYENVDDEQTKFQLGRHQSHQGGHLPFVPTTSIWDFQPVSGTEWEAPNSRHGSAPSPTGRSIQPGTSRPSSQSISTGDHLSKNGNTSHVTHLPSLDGGSVESTTQHSSRLQSGGGRTEADTAADRSSLNDASFFDDEDDVFSGVSWTVLANTLKSSLNRVSKMAAVSGLITGTKREQFSLAMPPRDRRKTTGDGKDDGAPSAGDGLRKGNSATAIALARTSTQNSLLTRSSRTLSNSNLSRMSESISFSTGNSSNAARRNAATGGAATARDKNAATSRGVRSGGTSERRPSMPRNQSDTDIVRFVNNATTGSASNNNRTGVAPNAMTSSVSQRQRNNDVTTTTTKASRQLSNPKRYVSGPSGNGAAVNSSTRPLIKSTSHPVLGAAAANTNAGASRSFNDHAVRRKQPPALNRSRRKTGNEDVDSGGEGEGNELVEAETQQRIIEWLREVGDERPERPPTPETYDDEIPPQTDTAIHIVYGGD